MSLKNADGTLVRKAYPFEFWMDKASFVTTVFSLIPSEQLDAVSGEWTTTRFLAQIPADSVNLLDENTALFLALAGTALESVMTAMDVEFPEVSAELPVENVDIGTIIPKSDCSPEGYIALLDWCNRNQRAQITDDGTNYEIAPPKDYSGWTAESVKARTAVQTVASLQRTLAVRSIPIDDDVTALAVAPVCPVWTAGKHYETGDIVNHDGQAYRVIQAVDALENQPPDAEGMLAIYRPIMPEHAGTLDDAIPFVNGMDVYNGKYYSYNDEVYLAKADMLPCTWAPGTEGIWQWELVQ